MKNKNMKIVYVDGGAFVEPPKYKFHDAYFTIVDEQGKLIYFNKNCGDIYSGEAEYLAIKWAIDNIKERPLKIVSDCKTAIAWAKHLTKASKKRGCLPLNLKDIFIEYQNGNLADVWNAQNYSPKKDKSFYYQRWLDEKNKS